MIVRPVSPRDDPELATKLLAVQHAAYAREAELIADDRVPALHEDIDDLCAARLRWLAAFVDEELAGAIGWAETDDELDIDRLVVASAMHRRGIGAGLVRTLLDRAGPRRVVVSTGRDNRPARALYDRLGFVRVDDHEVVPGLWITRYVRQPAT